MKKLMILCLSLCLLAGCGGGAKKTVKLYFADRAGQEILEEERSVQAKDSVLETAIRSLLSGPKTPGHTRVIPKDTELLGIKMRGTVAEINLSAPFDTGIDASRLLARYTVIYTACAVPEVQKVKLLVEGQPLTSLRNGELLGALGAADLSLAAPGSGTESLLTLYFADKTGKQMLPETRQVTLQEGQSVAHAIVTELIRGPVSAHLCPTLSPETRVISAEIRAGVCFVNFAENFLEKNGGDAAKETMAVYTIVNSLSMLPEVTEVHFLVEGKTVDLFGRIPLSRSFTENRALYPAP